MNLEPAKTHTFRLNPDMQISYEQFTEILHFKKEFIMDNKSPYDCPLLKKEVADSWVKSKNAGVDPYSPLVGEKMSSEQYQKIREANATLIKAASILFDTFKDLVTASSYALYLFDKNSSALLQYGLLFKPPIEYSDMIETIKNDVSNITADIEAHHDLEGIIWREEDVGTNAHTLSMQLKRPIQLIGPEHYSVALHHTIASAAPIIDENGEVIASIVLSQPLSAGPWSENVKRIRSHFLGLITTMAAAIEANMRLKNSNERLENLHLSLKHINRELEKANNNLKTTNETLAIAYDTLETILANIDDAIITIDPNGDIIHINQTGANVLNLSIEDIKRRKISDILNSQSKLLPLIFSGKNYSSVEETIISGKEEHSYLVNISPVLNKTTKQIEKVVLRFIQSEKINALVANRTGAIANYKFDDIIGNSPALNRAINLAKKFAGSKENVLLIGNSGTGKELFAQAIHNSYRPQGPFIAVNCAALPRELIESELFGYEGGSFTGAARSGRPGKIELADGGSLFLDEIGDMPYEVQSVLLRVLEDKQVMRVGGQRYKKVDFRLLAGTNRRLGEMVKSNLFREDLYYRLSVLSINIPPLRDRGDDVQILAHYFINKYCNKVDREPPRISDSALAIIKNYHWPGNVRQLENAIIYAVNSSNNDIIEPHNLPETVYLDSYKEQVNEDNENITEAFSLENLEKKTIIKAMMHTGNNVIDAANLLGISRSTLYRKLKDYIIET